VTDWSGRAISRIIKEYDHTARRRREPAGDRQNGGYGVRSMERSCKAIRRWYPRVSLVLSLSISLLVVFGGLMGCSPLEAPPTETPVPPTDTPAAQPDTTPQATREPLIPLDDDPVLGSPDAPVTLIEYSEYLCPYCRRFVLETMPLIEEEYIDTGKVKLVFRDYPVHGQGAIAMGMVAECAADQDKFWEMHVILFERVEEWSQSEDVLATILGYADELGLDGDVYTTCLEEGAVVERIREDYEVGIQDGVDATPTFFVNGTMIRGAQPLEEFQKVIDEELEKSS
jgi:protein-disulfide isomerase